MATAQDHDQLPPWTFRLHHGRIWLIWRCQPISARLPLPPPSVYQYQMLGDGGSQWHNWDLQNGLWFPQTLEIAGWCHWADGNKSVYTIIAGLLGDAENTLSISYICIVSAQSNLVQVHVHSIHMQIEYDMLVIIHDTLMNTCKHRHAHFLYNTIVVTWSWAVPVSLTFPDGFSVYVQRSHTSFVVTILIRVLIEFWDMCQAEDGDISRYDRGFTWKMSCNSSGVRSCKFCSSRPSPCDSVTDVWGHYPGCVSQPEESFDPSCSLDQ